MCDLNRIGLLLTLSSSLLTGSAFAANRFSLPEIFSKSGPVRTDVIQLPQLSPDANYSLLYSLPNLRALTSSSRVHVKLTDGTTVLVDKTLHAGDPDLYAPFHISHAAAPRLEISASKISGPYILRVNRWPVSTSLKRGSNHRREEADPMVLGHTVFASGDENEYIPLPGTSRKEIVSAPTGEDWYRFDFNGDQPKLVYFQVELMDRDNVPPDVSVFRVVDGKPKVYTDGQDPVTSPHEVQALTANKFTPRVLKESGTYYICVRANHPEYKLVTRLYDVPPYADPHQAVRTAADYIIAAGDSWFANTPRRGGLLDRVSSVHQETSLCVACHVSHFSQRAQLYAAVHGYPVVQREELKFLTDRFYNNPRPFYGFEKDGAVWARVISAPANVLSRMSVLMNIYEDQVSLEPRPSYHQGAAKYIDRYYAGRDKLPADETNGNTPLVSTYEVAWYSWKTTNNPRLPGMIAAGEVKNMIDLCYQTQALADIDRAKYRDQIQKNVDRILSLQRPDGQWSMKFDPKEPEVEFETGHALWALASAGVPVTNAQVQKGLQYLLGRQQNFGGWMDPLQSFENFRTPFRETQFAVLALSAYYPLESRNKGWNSPQPKALSHDPVELLGQLDQIWDRPSQAIVSQIEAAANSNDVLIRQSTAEALGRIALPSSSAVLTRLLGDPSKLVQRAAAWSLRQIYGRHEDADSKYVLTALASEDARERWGAARVFAHHFSALARRNEMVAAIEKRMSDPVLAVQLEAVQGLWQAWFWNANPETRGQIEDAVLAGLSHADHSWIEQNLRAAVYNLADENIRYLYNNWVPLLGRQEDQERAIRGRLEIEAQLATKFATVLEHGPDLQKKRLLLALSEFPQRRADIYDLDSDLSQPSPLVYSRIGNDIEQIAFFGPSAERVSKALLPLLDSSDPEMRRLAERASLIVRETSFAAVNRVAGDRGESTLAIAKKVDNTPDAAEVAKAFHLPATTKAKAAIIVATAPTQREYRKLDEAYFHALVEPILHKKGKDGYACADCHATHTLFNATWSTVMNVVDMDHPENSLILRKPTSTAESEGIAGSKQLAHGGGLRFQKGAPEYETILKWIEGEKLQNASAH
jgi:hypothetical protein